MKKDILMNTRHNSEAALYVFDLTDLCIILLCGAALELLNQLGHVWYVVMIITL